MSKMFMHDCNIHMYKFNTFPSVTFIHYLTEQNSIKHRLHSSLVNINYSLHRLFQLIHLNVVLLCISCVNLLHLSLPNRPKILNMKNMNFTYICRFSVWDLIAWKNSIKSHLVRAVLSFLSTSPSPKRKYFLFLLS